MRTRSIALLGFLLLAAPTLAAPPSPDPEAVVLRIRELQRSIDALLDALPPELRQEVERRLAEPEPAPAPPPPPPAPEPPAPPTEPVKGACNTLVTFDTDADGDIDAVDRYWRYLHLWVDTDGDGQIAETEVQTAYDRGVRAIAVSLKTFRKGKDVVGDVAVGEQIRLDLASAGLAAEGHAVLVIDATRLRRGDGPKLLGAGGELLEGFQVLRQGLRLQTAEGAETVLSCP